MKYLAITAATIALASCETVADINEYVVPGYDLALADRAEATLVGNEMEGIGSASLTQTPRGVMIRLEYSGLTPGWHGIHLHEFGDCSDPAFKSAGGHINPSGNEHGLLNPNGPDNADMPNIYVGEDGTGAAELYTTAVSIDRIGGDVPMLLDEDGSAIIIHVGEDDHNTQPIGGAGARAACGVIELVE